MSSDPNGNTDILFVNPQFSNECYYHLQFELNLGACYVIAFLREAGINAHHFTCKHPLTVKVAVDKILSFNPEIIGFTCHDINYFFIKLLCEEIKRRQRSIPIILGGAAPTFSDEVILHDTGSVDVCVRGEGEETMLELVEYYNGSGSLSEVNGVSYLSEGTLIRTADRRNLRAKVSGEELDIFPSPYISGVIPSEENIGVIMSRGCVYRCSYCCFSALSQWKVSFHSINRVMEELKILDTNLRSSGNKSPVLFSDNTFSLDLERAKNLCQRIIQEQISLEFACITRADHVDDELLDLMKSANFKVLSFGLESAVPENLRNMNKVNNQGKDDPDYLEEKYYINKVKENVKKSRDLGFKVAVSIITGSPGQTQEQAEATVEFVKDLEINYYCHDYMTMYPGTPLFESMGNYGLSIQNTSSVLPLKTQFTFDVTQVPVLKNAIQRRTIEGLGTNIVIDIFARKGFLSVESEGISTIAALDYNTDILQALKTDKIRNSLVLSPVVLFMGGTPGDRRNQLSDLITNELPLINLLALEEKKSIFSDSGKRIKMYELQFLTEVIERRRLPSQALSLFHFIPFSELGNYSMEALMENHELERHVFFLTISDERDKDTFYKILGDYSWYLDFRKNSEADCHLLNQCQWMNSLCPILQHSMLFMDSKGSNKHCSKCKPEVIPEHYSLISDLNSLPADLLIQRIEKERGCSKCSVNNSCSKCLITYPFSEDEFCKIRRGSDSEKLMYLIEKMNTMVLSNDSMNHLI